MYERLTDYILDKKERITLATFNYFMLVILIIVSYSKCIGFEKLEAKNAIGLALNGEFVIFLAWATCTIFTYIGIKFLLIRILVTSGVGMKLLASKIIPQEYQSLMLNVYYKGRLLNYQVDKAIAFQKSSKDDLESVSKTLTIFIGLIIKATLLVIVVIDGFTGIKQFVLWVTLCLFLMLLIYVVVSMILLKSKEKLLSAIESTVI